MYEDLEQQLEVARQQRSEMLEQRNRARQIAFGLSEHCKMINKKYPDLPFPHALIQKIDLARGIGGYKFPVDHAKAKEIIRNYHKSPEHLRNIARER